MATQRRPQTARHWHEPHSAATRQHHSSLSALVRSPRFLQLSAIAQKGYRSPLERFCGEHGTKPAKALAAPHIDAILARMADRPGAANNLRKALGRVFGYAIKLQWRSDNPVKHSDPFKPGPGFHCWSEEEIGLFCAHWPIGTKPRLALEMGLNTAARRCDVVKIGRSHIRGGRFEFTHAKGGNPASIPIFAECESAIDAMPVIGIDTLLITDFGKPFSHKGFGGWFREKCDAAGLPGCTFHGLRKAVSRRIAESGATSLQGRALTGQSQDSTFAYYAQSASARTMADAVVANLSASTLANRTKT